LAELLSDKESFVRSYAAASIGELQGHADIQKIRRVLEKEKQELAKVGMLEALFRLGQSDHFRQSIDLLGSSDYHVRCSVSNSLDSMPLSDAEMKIAIRALSLATRKALAEADRSTARRVLLKMKSQLN